MHHSLYTSSPIQIPSTHASSRCTYCLPLLPGLILVGLLVLVSPASVRIVSSNLFHVPLYYNTTLYQPSRRIRSMSLHAHGFASNSPPPLCLCGSTLAQPRIRLTYLYIRFRAILWRSLYTVLCSRRMRLLTSHSFQSHLLILKLILSFLKLLYYKNSHT